MSIYGIGTDIVEVRRVADILARHGARFAAHILTPEEMSEYGRSAIPERFIAKRFAAKEALSKAMGTGLRFPVSMMNMRVTHDALGKPGFAFSSLLQSVVDRAGIAHCHLSISDEKELVAAFVVLERGA